MRLGGGSSATGAGAVEAGGLVAAGACGGVGLTGDSVGAGATAGASATGAAVGGFVSARVAAGAGAAGPSCLRYWAATKAYASAGGSISIQSPLVLSSFNASPRFKKPNTL